MITGVIKILFFLELGIFRQESLFLKMLSLCIYILGNEYGIYGD